MYEEFYLKIENNYSINCKFSTFYEDNPSYYETDYQIKSTGKIDKRLTQKYSYDPDNDKGGDNLLSYEKSVDSYFVEFFLGEPVQFSEDEVKWYNYPNCLLGYKKDGKVDSSFYLTKPITLYDNQNRKWLQFFSYKSNNFYKSDVHYKRYFYDYKTQKINNIQEVKCYKLNDSIMSIAFRSGISDSIINKKKYIKFNYYTSEHSQWEPWFNSYFNLNSYDELKEKLTYLKKCN